MQVYLQNSFYPTLSGLTEWLTASSCCSLLFVRQRTSNYSVATSNRFTLNNYRLDTLEATKRLAESLVESLEPGALLILSGPLGSGKTTLTQHIGAALRTKAAISSPTYTLIHEYPTTQGTLVHIDAYRLEGAETLFELGLEDYLERARLVVVEWGEGLVQHFPDAFQIRLNLEQGTRTASFNRPLPQPPSHLYDT